MREKFCAVVHLRSGRQVRVALDDAAVDGLRAPEIAAVWLREISGLRDASIRFGRFIVRPQEIEAIECASVGGEA